MTLRERLDEELKQAMRSGDSVRRDVLRMVRSAAHNEAIARGKELEDDAVVEVISRDVKRHRESIEQFRSANRGDLVEKEEAELRVLLEYMPEQMSEEELEALAGGTIGEIGARGPADKGKVMGRLMPQVRGRAEGAVVSRVVDRLLQG